MQIIQELKRRNVFRVAAVYLIIAWLILQVGDTLAPALHLGDWINSALAFFLVLGFPIALVFAWAYEITPEGLKKEKDVDRSQSITQVTGRKFDRVIIVVLVLALGFFAFDKFVLDPSRDAELVQATTEAINEQADSVELDAADKSIAVLPFVNMSDDPGNEYFSDGIAEELLNVLVKVEGLRVASRTSSFSFKGKDISIPEIANELNVDHVLEGSVRKAGNTVRITAQLIDVRTDSHLWSETYDRELEDIFAIQDEISGRIVQALKVALGAGGQEAMAHAEQPTENLQAYKHYLKGRYFWQRRGEENILRAISLFEQATELDPQFARAWSSLAAAHLTLPAYSDALPQVQYPLGVSAAQKALALDDSLAEAYAVLGGKAALERKWAVGYAHDLNAVNSEPKNSTAHLWRSEHLVSVGRVHDALEEALDAYELDPLHPGTNSVLGGIYSKLDDTDNMIKYGADAWDLGHSGGLRVQAWANLRLGDTDRAIELATQFDEWRAVRFKSRPQFLRRAIEAVADAAKRPMFLEAVAQNESVLPLPFVISIYAGFGRIDDAYRVANLLLSHGPMDPDNTWWFLWDPEMIAFRQDPRFADLVTQLGLMDFWREHGWPDFCRPDGGSLLCE